MPRLGPREWWISLSAEQRFSAAVLGICGSVSLVLSMFYISYNLREPFLVQKTTVAASQKLFADSDAKSQETERSKAKDTDRDGLSDYAELYLYRTSPYLADSDSDGQPDSIEIAQGSDPNCPSGQNCAGFAVEYLPKANATSSYAELLASNEIFNSAAATAIGASDPRIKGAEEFVSNAPPPSSLTPGQIRDYLVKSQMVTSDSILDLKDEEIVSIYSTVYAQAKQIREARSLAGAAAAATSSTPSSPLND